MIQKVRLRLASDEGFTMIELLVVVQILSILVVIALPSLLNLRGNAQDAAAKSNVGSTIPGAAAFYQANNFTYTGMTNASLRALAPAIAPHVKVAVLSSGAGYCLEDNESHNTFYYLGGASTVGSVAQGTCAAHDGGVAAA